MVLEVKNLTTSFDTEAGRVNAIEEVAFNLDSGKSLGIVGESGCGKSVTALSIMRLIPKPFGKITAGEIMFYGEDILTFSVEEMRTIRGNRISMIFQEPMTALNPVHTIGKQIGEVYRLHYPGESKSNVRETIITGLEKVGIPDPRQRVREYPHQLSGGMRQRVVIAMALACRPDILIADEPTTALDVTIQAQILKLIKDLQEESGTAIIFITHDLGVIAETCNDVAVMYAGKVVERAPVVDIFESFKHPYTQGLLASIPKLSDQPKSKLFTIPGSVPDLMNLPKGCRFQNRCRFATDICRTTPPLLETVVPNHEVACHHWQSLNLY